MSDSKRGLVLPMSIQLHLIEGLLGHGISGAPPWADQQKLMQWGEHVERVLRKHDVKHGIRLMFERDGRVVALYHHDCVITPAINAEVVELLDVLTDALLTDRETVESYKLPEGLRGLPTV